jgi:hypothetical protein
VQKIEPHCLSARPHKRFHIQLGSGVVLNLLASLLRLWARASHRHRAFPRYPSLKASPKVWIGIMRTKAEHWAECQRQRKSSRERRIGVGDKVTPKFFSPSDPAAQWTGATRGPAFFGYSDNYLIDVKFGVIMDVEASRAIRQAVIGSSESGQK